MRTSLFFLFVIILISCTTSQQESKTVDHYKDLPSDLTEVLKAHGGLDKWRSYGTLEYDLQHENDSVPTEHYILDLQNRKDLTVADSFKIGFDGKIVWVAPNKSSYKGRSARFYHNLYSYFLNIPFMVADPGAKYASDTLTLDGKLYEVINVSFEEGVGDADADTYKLLINPSTHQMEKLLYTVTYYSGEPHENYNALSYENFKMINDLLFPTTLVGYKYNNGSLGEKRYEVNFHNIQLKAERPDQSIFTMPGMAEIDSLKIN